MPRASGERSSARKEEIINACAALYETMSFRDITLRDIGARTSFTRTSIYNYFQTKEEIFLALLQREHQAWSTDMEALSRQPGDLDAEGFADTLARILEKRRCMLKLMSMNLYDMERNSRMENLVSFKRTYASAVDALDSCLGRFFPDMAQEDRTAFFSAFFPFLFGIHPFTAHTQKQLEAMRQAGIASAEPTIYELTKPFLLRLLK